MQSNSPLWLGMKYLEKYEPGFNFKKKDWKHFESHFRYGL
jgi:hypothetical protein